MLAAPVDVVPESPDLLHEPKWDGWRCIAFRETDGVYLQSRAGRNLTTYFPNPRELHRMGSLPSLAASPGAYLRPILPSTRGRVSWAFGQSVPSDA
ncbi:hypothetical protein ACFWDZ_12980 [Micromonospora aurantiaca]|uniref:hypothetical protein n=1 Tax=Micromonospora aurantiaca (nom. illeg.) TaxID=47850 RepID=UPI0036611B52